MCVGGEVANTVYSVETIFQKNELATSHRRRPNGQLPKDFVSYGDKRDAKRRVSTLYTLS